MWLPWKSGSAQELLSYTSTGEMSPARNWMIGCRPKKKSRTPRKSSGNGIRADPRECDGGRCSIAAMFATSLGRSSTDGPPSELDDWLQAEEEIADAEEEFGERD